MNDSLSGAGIPWESFRARFTPAALERLAHAETLRGLGLLLLAPLIEEAAQKSTGAAVLEALGFSRLLHLAETACKAPSAALALQGLGFAQVVELYAKHPLKMEGELRFRALRMEGLLPFFQRGAEDSEMAQNLLALHFPRRVRGLREALESKQPLNQLVPFDAVAFESELQNAMGVRWFLAEERTVSREHRRAAGTASPENIFARLRQIQAWQEEKQDAGFQVSFFSLLRSLQAAFADFPKIGASESLRQDYVRLSQQPDLAFPYNSIRRIVAGAPGRPEQPAQISVNFLGLWGPHGPMPLQLTGYVLARMAAEDFTLQHFADLFQHRALSFFFRAWAVHRKTVDLDRPDDRRFANYVASLIGLGMPSLRDRDQIPDLAKFYFAGRLAAGAKNPEGLAAILAAFFGTRCEVQNFIGQWIEIPPAEVCLLGGPLSSGALGETTIVGSRVHLYDSKFRVRLGPMRLVDLRQLLPRETGWPRLQDWVRTYNGEELAWDAQYVLLASEIPETVLGEENALLGWTTWLLTEPPTEDADDIIIDGDLPL